MNYVGLNSQERQEIFLSPKFQRVPLVATQVSNSMSTGGSFHRGKAAGGCEADTSSPPSASIKHENSYILPMLYDKFTFTSEILFLKRLGLFTEKATELLSTHPHFVVLVVHRDGLKN